MALFRRDLRFHGWSVMDLCQGAHEVVIHDVSLVLLWPDAWLSAEELAVHVTRARSGYHDLVLFGSDDELSQAAVELDELEVPALTLVTTPASSRRVVMALQSAAANCRLRLQAARLQLELDRANYENDMLISIGRALSQQRDIPSLLEIILQRAREVTGADAGSIYIVDGTDEGIDKRRVRFVVSQNDSIGVESTGFAMKGHTMPVTASSIVGHCVLSRDVVNIEDLYKLDPPGVGNNPWGFVHDRSFDDKHSYQTRSMLTVPMISYRKQVIGVIQLINKWVRGRTRLTAESRFATDIGPFDEVSVKYATTLASQAGIALETALLYAEVQTLFEGFVRASVTAIESRDPTTSGHSERVAKLTVELAKVTDRMDHGRLAKLRFTPDDLKQIEYAALLHDFGKVGVREHVLVKAKKLYDHQRALILQRFQFIKKTLENETLQSKVSHLLQASAETRAAELVSAMPGDLARLEGEAANRIAELDEYVRFILAANEPTVLAQGGFERIAELAARRYLDHDGVEQPYLTPAEAEALQVLRGSLTPEERFEIESHVVHTYNFLRQIPWGRAFRNIPTIAGAHHEKLDGTGYPNRLVGENIPAPARMMTISDIYDALTAADRPYKRAMPVDKALDILAMEVKDGKLDGELFRVFVDAKVFEITR